MNNIPFNIFSRTEKISFYGRVKADYLCMDAIFSDETNNFVKLGAIRGGRSAEIKIRVAKNNIDEAYIHYEGNIVKLAKATSNGAFDYYTAVLQPESGRVSYYFSIVRKDRVYFYNKRGLYDFLDEKYNFTLLMDFKTPDWAKGAVIYQIFVDRFYNGDKTNDVVNNEYAYLGRAAKKIDNWDSVLTGNDMCNFYGGDLQGVIDKMEYLHELGVEVIYFNPLFVSPSSHKYDVQDFDYIDPHFGKIVEDGGEQLYFEKFHNKYATKYRQRTTNKANLEASNELMSELIKCAHSYGIKVIIDGVFNHCGSYNKWLDKEGLYAASGEYPSGAYKDEKSPYHNFFRWYDYNWPNNDCYDSWWGHDNHPKLNFEKSPELFEYILDIGRKWVSPPYNADGWRLDVASDLGYSPDYNHRFWKAFRKAVKEANPNALILAEHYGDPSRWLQGDEWDTIMNYDAFMEPLSWFLTGMEKHSEQYRADLHKNAMAFETSMRAAMARLPLESLLTSMNELSNHDHSRFLTRTNMKPGRLHTHGSEEADCGINKSIFYEAVVFQMTWPGAPTIYYGDEAGLTGWTDPDNRRTYPWDREDRNMIKFHNEIIQMHKRYDAFKCGSVEFLYSRYGIASFGRWDDKTKIVVIINNNDSDQALDIPVWKIETKLNTTMQLIMHTYADGYSTDTLNFPVNDGMLKINMLPYSSAVLIEN